MSTKVRERGAKGGVGVGKWDEIRENEIGLRSTKRSFRFVHQRRFLKIGSKYQCEALISTKSSTLTLNQAITGRNVVFHIHNSYRFYTQCRSHRKMGYNSSIFIFVIVAIFLSSFILSWRTVAFWKAYMSMSMHIQCEMTFSRYRTDTETISD